MPDILTIGEALVNFVATEAGVVLREAQIFEKVAGGTPAIAAVGLSRLGMSSGFIGRVGDDPFGHFVAGTLAAEHVDVSQLSFEQKAPTGVVFTSLTEDGKQDVIFFQRHSAAMFLSPGHVNPSYVKSTRAVVYSSNSLAAEPCRSGVLKALAIALDAGLLRIYDTNLCLSLWETESQARYGLQLGLDRADVAIFSQRELEFLSGTRELLPGTQKLWNDRMRLMIVTLGAQGCAYRTATHFGQVPGYRVETVDTSAAGDGFLSGLLAELLATDGRKGANTDLSFDRETVEHALRFANAAGALTTTRRGAMPALPDRTQVETLCR